MPEQWQARRVRWADGTFKQLDMMLAGTAQQFLDTALNALASEDDWRSSLDALPVPIYTTDADGAVTYWNRACVEFAGREPMLGADRWCVTWRLYSTLGDFIPHEECPMAEAIRSRKPVRGKIAIAARPDGRRRAFRAYPTPLFGDAGEFTGAINLLLDVTEEQAGELVEQSARCGRLARATTDASAREILLRMAKTYAETAATLGSAD